MLNADTKWKILGALLVLILFDFSLLFKHSIL